MNTLVLIPCTDRKRILPSDHLRARNLPVGSVRDVATEWGRRTSSSNARSNPDELYCGRAYREARVASNLLGAELVVISAGHGLVRQGQKIPAYGLTAATGKTDSVQKKVTTSDWSGAGWWRALGENTSSIVSLSDLFLEVAPELVLISLSESYANLLCEQLAFLDETFVQRLRIFGMGLSSHLPANVVSSLMPYDGRLNGPDSPISGTMSDFSSRALHHYAQSLDGGLLSGRAASDDRLALEGVMDVWSMPATPVRKKMTDDEVIGFIQDNWGKTRGRSGASLRLLRDSGNACEQGRFKNLFMLAVAGLINAQEGIV